MKQQQTETDRQTVSERGMDEPGRSEQQKVNVPTCKLNLPVTFMCAN